MDMSHLLSEGSRVELDREIALGLARTKSSFHSVGYEYSRGDAALDLYDHQFKDVKIAESELEPWEKNALSEMNHSERHKYLKYAKGAYHPWSVCYSLLNSFEWNSKMVLDCKGPTEEAKVLFPKTLEWCYSVPIFKGIGRICIFGVDAGQHVTCHRDMSPEEWAQDDELLMVSPRGNKKFYLYDPEKREKEYVNSNAFIFHDLNYHGVDPHPYFTYSFRIDGIYTDEFKKSFEIKRPKK